MDPRGFIDIVIAFGNNFRKGLYTNGVLFETRHKGNIGIGKFGLFVSQITVKGGPDLHLGLSGSAEVGGESQDIEDITLLQFGIAAGVAYQINDQISVDVRFQQEFAELAKDSESSHQLIGASVGYMF